MYNGHGQIISFKALAFDFLGAFTNHGKPVPSQYPNAQSPGEPVKSDSAKQVTV